MKNGAIKHGNRLRLNRSAFGMALRNGKEVSIPIPEGTIVEIIGGPFKGTRLMDVRCNDEMVLMFRADLERGSRAEGNSATSPAPLLCRE
jgi:hypothetical protein